MAVRQGFFLLGLLSLHLSIAYGCSRSCDDERKEIVVKMEASDAVDPDKEWLFAVDGRKRPYSFLNNVGKLVGFDVDLINEVCSVAGKKCSMVLAEFPECALTERDITYAGRGLMSKWFDACPSYAITLDRMGAADFTLPYLQTDVSFTVAPGNPSGFNPSGVDYSTYVITHLTGAPSNSHCLQRLKKTFGKIIIAKDLPEAKALLLNRTADVLFSPRHVIPDLEVLPARLRCDIGGAGMMVKKGSLLPSWWNPAFEKFAKSQGLAVLCSTAQVKYNATIKCLQESSGKSETTLRYEAPPANKTWLFAVSGRRKPFNYLDENGNMVGFDVDFIKKVCAKANVACKVVLTQFTECGFTERNINYPGRGLMDGWVDACTGYSDSLDRENGVDFTDAYLASGQTFTVVPGNPSGFDPNTNDYSRFTFTHLTGAYTNAQCLNRLNKTYGNIIIADNLPDAKRILFNREADVLFSPRSKIPDLETFPMEVHCEQTGTSMMIKKGSPLASWWNPAFRAMVSSGEYNKLCDEGRAKYNYPVNCFPKS